MKPMPAATTRCRWAVDGRGGRALRMRGQATPGGRQERLEHKWWRLLSSTSSLLLRSCAAGAGRPGISDDGVGHHIEPASRGHPPAD